MKPFLKDSIDYVSANRVRLATLNATISIRQVFLAIFVNLALQAPLCE